MISKMPLSSFNQNYADGKIGSLKQPADSQHLPEAAAPGSWKATSISLMHYPKQSSSTHKPTTRHRVVDKERHDDNKKTVIYSVVGNVSASTSSCASSFSCAFCAS
jgi:hypothetical protein